MNRSIYPPIIFYHDRCDRKYALYYILKTSLNNYYYLCFKVHDDKTIVDQLVEFEYFEVEA